MRACLRQILLRPVALAMACCAVALGGLVALMQLPLTLAPSLDLPALTVHMSQMGASAESVEETLTAPVEEIAGSLPGVRKVRSSSQEGRSRVSVQFDPRTDMDLARTELNEQLSVFARRLPHGASYPVVERSVPEDLERLQGFLTYSLAGPFPRTHLALLARQEIIPQLMSVKGVSRVMLQGGEDEEVRVELVPERLMAAHVRPGEVMAALEAFRPGSVQGNLNGPAGTEAIRFTRDPAPLDELERLPVLRVETHASVRLGDVGRITIAPTVPAELWRIKGEPCLMLAILRDPRSSMPGTANEVKACVARLSDRLPPQVKLACEMDRSRLVTEELRLLSRDALLALLVLEGILMIFLGSNRAALVLVSSVLLSITGTLLVLWILRIPLHLLTLAGLTLGMGRLLDDSIVVLENLRRWTEPGTDVDAIVEGTHEVVLPVVASTITTVGAMVPMVFVTGDLKVLAREFTTAAAASLFISLLVSFTVIPAALLHWNVESKSFLVEPRGRTASGYRWVLSCVLRHRVLVLVIAAWMFGFPVWLLPPRLESDSLPAIIYNRTIGGSWYAAARPVINALLGGASYQFVRNVPHADFLEPETETVLLIQANFPRGTGIARADAMAAVLEGDLLRAGAPRLTTHVFGDALLLRIDFPDTLASGSLPRLLRNRCFRLAAQTGGATVSVAGFGAGFSGGADLQPSFTVRVLGYDYTRVKHIAETVREKLLHNPRVASIDIDRAYGNWSKAQEVALLIDRQASILYGVSRQDLAAAVRSRTTVFPQRLSLNVGGVQLPCTVTMKGSDQFSVTDLGSVEVAGRNSPSVPLRSLLGAQLRDAPSEIVREDQQYVRWISFEYKGPYRHAQAFLDATLEDLPLPDGYRFDRSDTAGPSGKDRDSMLVALFAGLLVMFMVTASLYESLLDPFIVMLSVPFAYIGLFLAFVLSGAPFDKGGYLSLVFLTGIAVANAIVIVDFIVRKEKEGRRGMETVIEASVCRLRPVLMTSLTTAGGLIPMLFGERSSVWYTMALGTLGGILSSMVLTLVVVPAIYAVANRIKN